MINKKDVKKDEIFLCQKKDLTENLFTVANTVFTERFPPLKMRFYALKKVLQVWTIVADIINTIH